MSNLATIVNNILADSGIDDINVVVTTGSYSNPAWITSLAWTKITGAPSNIVTGTGTSGQISFWNGTTTQAGDNGLLWNNSSKLLRVVNGGIEINNGSSTGLLYKRGDAFDFSIENSTGNLEFFNYGADDRIMRLVKSTNRVSIGNDPSPTSKLFVRGVGSTSATFSFNIVNSSLTNLLSVRDDGQVSTSGNILMNNNLVATQSWVNSQGFVTGGPFAALNGNTSNSFGVLELTYAATTFNPAAAPRTTLNPMSVKMWNNYFNGTGLGSDYGTVMEYYSLGSHVDSQVYFDAGGGSWYRSSAYLAGWQAWREYITSANIGSQSVSFATTAGSITGQANSATITAATAATANTIVLRDGSGDIYSRYSFSAYVNTSDNDEAGITRFVIKNGDNYHRSATTTVAADIIRGVASGSWGINITGNANTLDNYDETAFVRLSPNSSTPTNGNFAMGNASSRNFIQSHSGQPLDLNPLGNQVFINGSEAVRNTGTWGINITGSAGSAGSVAWGNVSSKPSNIMFYEGFVLEANSMTTNATGFTYAAGAPYVGPIVRFSAGGGYDMWLNATYNSNGTQIAFRTRNGDAGTFNPWWVLLNSANYNSYAPTLGGDGASGTWGISITGNAATATEVVRTVAAGSDANLVSATIADNDFFRIRTGGPSNAGFVEIATADDSNEPIYVRQYTGTFTSLTRTATILDGSGNTSFPGNISAANLSGTNTGDQTNISGNAATVSSITGNTGLMINRLAPNNLIDGLTTTNFRSTLFNTTAFGYAIATSRWNSVPAPLSGLNMYGTMIAWSGADTQGFLAVDYVAPAAILGGGNSENIQWTKNIAFTDGTGASGTWGISITGNAATATSANNIDGVSFVNTDQGTSTNPDTINSNGISYTLVNLLGQTDGALYSQAYSSAWQHQIFGDYRTGQIAIRGKNSGTWQAWRTVLDSSNYNSYAPTLTGGGATGTWAINISGNASSATNAGNSNTVANLSPPLFFNNMGQPHSAYTNANNVGNFGARYLNQPLTNGPNTGSSQYYGFTLGLGADYSFDAYASQFYWGRFGNPYVSVRFNEGGSWSAWSKIWAGYADSAGSVAWTNVSGRPTALSAFTNDTGFISNSSDAFPSIPRTNFIVTLTAAEYAALSPKQTDTLYVVV